MKAILIKAPITLRLEEDIGAFPLTKCPLKVGERHIYKWFFGSDPAYNVRRVKIPISRRNKDIYLQLLKDRIKKKKKNCDQGPGSGFVEVLEVSS